MGKYDIPAVINFVLDKTGRRTMSYIGTKSLNIFPTCAFHVCVLFLLKGHSMGCAVFLICMSLRPEFNAKIDVMIALAPAASLAEAQTSIRYQARFVNQLVVYV